MQPRSPIPPLFKMRSRDPARNLTPAPGVYIHVPFCRRKCRYCDFYSTTRDGRIPAYLEALQREMALRSAPLDADSLYLGGGTPSLLAPAAVAAVIDNVAECFGLAADSEITLEANPGTLTPQRLADYRQAGVNRLSIGVQSFENENLKFLGRIHRASEAVTAITQARRAGFDNMGLDLIYGLPGQGREAWQRDLTLAVGLAPEHLSCYMLTIEDGTPLAHAGRAKQFEPLDDTRLGALFTLTHELLSGVGYQPYEISNFACTPALRSRHNQKYWHQRPYMGLGPAAHSYSGARRSWNHGGLDRYVNTLAAGEFPMARSETLTPVQRMIESIYLGLRTAEGICLGGFQKKFGVDFQELLGPALQQSIRRGLLRLAGGRCRLSARGRLLADSVTGLLVARL